MAAKPIERFIKRQIAAQGGWDRILERIASGETVADIARTFLRQPGGPAISRAFFSRLLHADPARSAQVSPARKEGASAMVDDAVHIVDSAPLDRDSTNNAKVRAELRVKVAGFIDREAWGEKGQQVNVTVNQFDLHLNALRHRMIEASQPLDQTVAAAGRTVFRLRPGTGSENGPAEGASRADSEPRVSRACGTDTGQDSLPEQPPQELPVAAVDSQKVKDDRWLRGER